MLKETLTRSRITSIKPKGSDILLANAWEPIFTTHFYYKPTFCTQQRIYRDTIPTARLDISERAPFEPIGAVTG